MLLNYTTKIDPAKTAAEIMQILSKAGARKVIVDYNGDGQPVALSFQILWGGIPTAYTLPARHEGVQKVLNRQGAPPKFRTDEQALRVAWRIVKDWVEAQLAIVEAEVASLPEVFLPYAVTSDGQTVFDKVQQHRDQLQLPNAS